MDLFGLQVLLYQVQRSFYFCQKPNIYLSVYDKYRKGRAILSRYTVVDQKVEISVAPQIILLSSQTINTLSNLQTTKTKYIADFEIYIFLVTPAIHCGFT